MKFCSLAGISPCDILLLPRELAVDFIPSIVSLFNNRADAQHLLDFKQESEYVLNILNTCEVTVQGEDNITVKQLIKSLEDKLDLIKTNFNLSENELATAKSALVSGDFSNVEGELESFLTELQFTRLEQKQLQRQLDRRNSNAMVVTSINGITASPSLSKHLTQMFNNKDLLYDMVSESKFTETQGRSILGQPLEYWCTFSNLRNYVVTVSNSSIADIPKTSIQSYFDDVLYLLDILEDPENEEEVRAKSEIESTSLEVNSVESFSRYALALNLNLSACAASESCPTIQPKFKQANLMKVFLVIEYMELMFNAELAQEFESVGLYFMNDVKHLMLTDSLQSIILDSNKEISISSSMGYDFEYFLSSLGSFFENQLVDIGEEITYDT